MGIGKRRSENDKEKLRELSSKNHGTGKTILLDEKLEEIKKASIKGVGSTIQKMRKKPAIIIIDGTVTAPILNAAEESGIQIIVAKNFATTDTNIQLLSL